MKRGDKVRITNKAIVELNAAIMNRDPEAKPINEGKIHVIREDDIVVKFPIPADKGRVRFEARAYPKNEVELIKK